MCKIICGRKIKKKKLLSCSKREFSIHNLSFVVQLLSSTTTQKHQSFGIQPSLCSNSHIWTWVLEKPCCCCSVTQSCLTLCDPKDYTVHGILQARILEWVGFAFSRQSSQSRDLTQVSCIADIFFTSWATKEAQESWSRYPFPSPEDLPNPGIELASSALQADSLPTELSGKP